MFKIKTPKAPLNVLTDSHRPLKFVELFLCLLTFILRYLRFKNFGSIIYSFSFTSVNKIFLSCNFFGCNKFYLVYLLNSMALSVWAKSFGRLR